MYKFLASAFVVGVLTSCGSSHWQSTYDGVIADRDEILAPNDVVVRDVPWERLEVVLGELRAEIAASDLHPDEWAPSKKAVAKAKLLTGLQVSEPPDDVEVLGRSEFRTTDSIRPGDGQLAEFAASIGANRVIWSNRHLGKADRIEHEPVSTTSWGTGWFRTPDDRRRIGHYQEQSTTWVPLRVKAEEYGWLAFFLRITQPGGLPTP